MKIAVVQIRGTIHMDRKIKDTFKSLKLVKKNSCVVINNDRNYLGMLVSLKDYITWGEVSKETFRMLIEKRGRVAANQSLTSEYLKKNFNLTFEQFVENFFDDKNKLRDVPGLKPFFRLKPPVGGFGKEGTKKPYSLGGTLGYRGEKINDLIRRML